MPEQTTVKVTADLSQLKQEFASGTAEFNRWAQNINAGNATAMRAFRDTAEELRQLGKDARVSNEAMDQLNATIGRVENAAASAGERSANAFERGARGLSVMARQGDVTARSLNQIIAAGSDIAFAFGPEGAILSGVLMVTAGIVAHVETSEQKMADLVASYNDKMNQLLMDGRAIDAARAEARAFVKELEDVAKAKSDILNRRTSITADWRVITGADDDAIAKDRAEKEAAAQTAKILANIEVHDKDLKRLKDERKEANDDIVRAQAKLDGMERKGHEADYAATERARQAAQARLTELETRTRDLEADRHKRVWNAELNARGNDAREQALGMNEQNFEKADFDAEHAERDHAMARADLGAGERRAARDDAARAKSAEERRRQNDEMVREQARATALLLQMQDNAAQHEALSDDQREKADKAKAQRDYDRRVAEIESIHVTEARKTTLLVAAAQERDAAIAAVERTAYDRQQNVLLKNMTERLKLVDKEVKAEEEAEKKKEQTLTQILASSGEALVRGHGDLAHRIMQAALEPEVKYLEAMAMKHYALAAKDAATQNWVGAAEQLAGATALMAGASLVASFAGGGGGGGGGGSAGGGGMSSASHLGASGGAGNRDPLQVHVIVVHQDANGREISRMRQEFQRLDDRNVSTRIGALS